MLCAATEVCPPSPSFTVSIPWEQGSALRRGRTWTRSGSPTTFQSLGNREVLCACWFRKWLWWLGLRGGFARMRRFRRTGRKKVFRLPPFLDLNPCHIIGYDSAHIMGKLGSFGKMPTRADSPEIAVRRYPFRGAARSDAVPKHATRRGASKRTGLSKIEPHPKKRAAQNTECNLRNPGIACNTPRGAHFSVTGRREGPQRYPGSGGSCGPPPRGRCPPRVRAPVT